MKIMYIHGFASSFDKTNVKVKSLESLGVVIGCDIDYTKSIDSITNTLKTFIIKNKIDVLVGTSMGGFYANRLGNLFKIPFVMLNPAIEPDVTLRKIPNNNLTEKLIDSYKNQFKKTGMGLLFLEKEDELIDADNTYNICKSKFTTYMISGGNHRFTNIDKALPIIENFIHKIEITSGIHND